MTPAIVTRELTFAYAGGPPVLKQLSLEIPRGSRCLLLGANGAGKTTLLRILGGKHLVREEVVRVLGKSAFHATDLVHQVSFIGGPFPFDVDIRVGEVVAGQGPADPARLDMLMEVLGVDPAWRMCRLSDGQRRRVQILLHLLRPVELLLLDEVTADLDVLARADLLGLLKSDAEQRGSTLLYATHVLDGLDRWATHLCYLKQGQLFRFGTLGEIAELQELRASGEASPLLRLVEGWLRAEQLERRAADPARAGAQAALAAASARVG
jgi:CCR4-NOT complex subunit CAF16